MGNLKNNIQEISCFPDVVKYNAHLLFWLQRIHKSIAHICVGLLSYVGKVVMERDKNSKKKGTDITTLMKLVNGNVFSIVKFFFYFKIN